ncbi:UDP-glucose dehydrogenase family protein [Cohnella suwonensis]|uniref:UDP-glucose 6-dehydrogenase n=1 Tax=Cohnella suwonensis TaxID=696072 RepID=A0ABW0LSZ4_9BACL
MKISVIGTGYVGLIQGTVLADFGHEVLCMDTDNDKIKDLQAGSIPFYEPGVQSLLHKNISANKISFTSDIKQATEHGDILFIAVGTPSEEDGSADVQQVLKAASEIGSLMNGNKVIVIKSTVPIGTGRRVADLIRSKLTERRVEFHIDFVSNPEFLREGNALQDMLRPTRVIIGTDNRDIVPLMNKLYSFYESSEVPFVITDIETAEMIKYASNAFLAVKISFINEIALIAEKAGANVLEIAAAMGMDERISPHFLQAGPGYGGSCFPKDTKAFAYTARSMGEMTYVIQAAIDANEKQKLRMVDKITAALSSDGNLHGKTIAVLGLSFKPETDDIREAPSIDIISNLIRKGAIIRAYCPGAMTQAQRRLKEVTSSVTYAKDEIDCAAGADALVIMTEWKQFLHMDLEQIRYRMSGNVLLDLRNILVRRPEVRRLFDYRPIGLK